MAEGGKGKSPKKVKEPITSPVGLKMEEILARCKMDKSHKSQHEVVQGMHGTVGLLKKAYLAGVKYAEESVAVNSDDEQSHAVGQASGEEKIIDSLRRGWPDPLKRAQRLFNTIAEKTNAKGGDDGKDVKSLAKLTKHSPDVTV